MKRQKPDRGRSVTLPPDWMWWNEVQALSPDARWHFLALITHCADCQDYDGTMTINKARNQALDHARKVETLTELVDSGFVEIFDGEIRIVDVEQYMPARAIIERRTSHCLYRLFDANGALLYIGRTWNVRQRLQEHARVQPWWSEVSTHTVERMSSFSDLSHAETVAIATESPRYNVVRSEWHAKQFKGLVTPGTETGRAMTGSTTSLRPDEESMLAELTEEERWADVQEAWGSDDAA